jgi:hypothetical protein
MSNGRMDVKDELGRMWKEAVTTYFMVLFQNLTGVRKTTQTSG